jgi:DNA-binding Lrp family transcriptional regulator
MDAFVYVRTAPGSARRVAEQIAALDVREVVVITGHWDVMVAVERVDAEGLGTKVLDEIQRVPGVTRTKTAPVVDAKAAGLKGPRPSYPVRGKVLGATGLVHVNIQAGTGQAVVNALAKSKAVTGMALLAGDVDILLEVTAKDWNALTSTVMSEVQSVAGVARTETSLIVGGKLKAAQRQARKRTR